MLVLDRKPQEKIVIGDVTITIVGIRSGKVSIGIEAPRETPIYRAELAPEGVEWTHRDRAVKS
jgi:carbon storage regulator